MAGFPWSPALVGGGAEGPGQWLNQGLEWTVEPTGGSDVVAVSSGENRSKSSPNEGLSSDGLGKLAPVFPLVG